MTFASVYAIIIGVVMVAQWTISLARRQVAGPEAGSIVGRGRIELGFHYVAEFATAIALVAAGSGLLLEASWGLELFLVSVGMLVYTAVNSPGYFAQQRAWPMVAVFAAVLVLALVSIALVV